MESHGRMLVVGCGLLGSALVESARERGLTVGFTHLNTPCAGSSLRLDVTSREQVLKVVRGFRPDVVIHTAAMTGVDRCEGERVAAWRVNVGGALNVALACEGVGAKVVYVSTDYVFDGEKGCYLEGDPVNPINYYGLTKLEGERRVMEASSNWIVARSSVIFGLGRPNFATWLLEELGVGRRVNILVDQFTSPTFNIDLAEMILALVEQDETGVFNTAGRERISRLDFTRKLAREFKLDISLVTPVEMGSLNWKARRPRDSSLNVGKVSRIKRPLDVGEALTIMESKTRGG